MKIVVYNSHGQYAVSRAEAEAIGQVLPKAAWSRIQELHLAHSHPRCAAPFEFDEASRIGYLIVPVDQKTEENRREAIAALLIGVARVQAGSHFFCALKPKERDTYQEFVEEWLPQCEAAIVRLHARA